MSDENERDPILEAVLRNAEAGDEPRVLSIGPDGEATMLDVDDLDRMFLGEPEEPPTELAFGNLPEGTEVSITAPIDMSAPVPEELTLTGKIRGWSVLPAGVGQAVPAYIVELDEPERVPDGPDGEKFEYTCIVFPQEIVQPIKTVEDDG